MTHQQTSRLLSLLRANGVQYFKSPTHEIRLGALDAQPAGHAVGPSPLQDVPRRTQPPSSNESNVMQPSPVGQTNNQNAGDVPVKEMVIPHQLNEMISVMKMSDEELVDKIFPEGKPPEEGGS
jgi:hypothetical protein